MNVMIDAEERAAAQRAFYLNLSPQTGQILAHTMTGVLPPGDDSQESELRDALELWFKMANSGGMSEIADTAWWMTRYQDRNNRMSKDEASSRSDELASFAVATVGALINKGILQFKTEPAIPKLVTSTFDPDRDAIDKALLARMEASMKEQKHE